MVVAVVALVVAVVAVEEAVNSNGSSIFSACEHISRSLSISNGTKKL